MKTKKELLNEFETVIAKRYAFSEDIIAKFDNKAFREGFQSGRGNVRLHNNPYYNDRISPRKSQGKKYYQYIDGAELGKTLSKVFR